MADTPAVVLRRLKPEDVPAIARFEREIAEISFPDDPVTDLAFYERKLQQAVTDSKSEPMVGEAGGRIVAWAWIGARENFITRERYGELRSFYVIEDFRGTGYAIKLMRACLDYCATHGLARLSGRTHAANEAMQSVYEMYGFEAKHVVYERRVAPASESVASSASARRPRPKPGEGLFRKRRGKKPR
ncbi:MAG TPA: GNAT family N-acetyltransferase [Xanthobacteraceae bacterium]|nr:GNAT family N-acetyltransferase [Xanthobacteraceae bacterium]